MRAPKGTGSYYKTASGWRGYVPVDGVRVPFTAKTKAEALAKQRDLLNRRDKGTLATGKDMSLEAWMRHWLTVANLKPAVRDRYEWTIDAYIAPSEAGATKLSKLKTEHLEKLYARMSAGEAGKRGRPLSPRTIGGVHANIRAALNVALARGHVGSNVALHAVTPSKPKADTTSFSEADARAILAAAQKDRYAARWSLGLMYGIRPAEVLGLAWEAVDLERGQVHIHAQLQRVKGRGLVRISTAKTAAGERVVPIAPVVVDQLREMREKQMQDRVKFEDEYTEWEQDGEPVGLVFTLPNGRPVDPRRDSEYWKDLLASTGLKHARRYQLRHTAATLMLDMGADVIVVAATLGHANASFTYDTYVHPLEVRKAELGAMMGGLAGPYDGPYGADNSRQQPIGNDGKVLASQ